MRTGTREARAHTRFERQTSEGKKIWRTDFFGPPPSPASSDSVRPDASNSLEYIPPAPGETREPQAFLVEQSEGAIVHPHFHFVDQFQVVVDGGGSLGRHPVGPISVHFAAAHTGYGPITPGPDGLKYFTLRATADETGAQYLPVNRHKMRAVPKKNVVVDAIAVESAQSLVALTAVQHVNFEQDAAGLRVDTICMPPGHRVSIAGHGANAGVMVLVVAGQVECAAQPLTRWSCVFKAPGEPDAVFNTNGDGAQLLVLQFPATNA